MIKIQPILLAIRLDSIAFRNSLNKGRCLTARQGAPVSGLWNASHATVLGVQRRLCRQRLVATLDGGGEATITISFSHRFSRCEKTHLHTIVGATTREQWRPRTADHKRRAAPGNDRRTVTATEDERAGVAAEPSMLW